MKHTTINYEEILRLLRQGKRISYLGVPCYKHKIEGATIRHDTWRKLYPKMVVRDGKDKHGDYSYKLREQPQSERSEP